MYRCMNPCFIRCIPNSHVLFIFRSCLYPLAVTHAAGCFNLAPPPLEKSCVHILRLQMLNKTSHAPLPKVIRQGLITLAWNKPLTCMYMYIHETRQLLTFIVVNWRCLKSIWLDSCSGSRINCVPKVEWYMYNVCCVYIYTYVHILRLQMLNKTSPAPLLQFLGERAVTSQGLITLAWNNQHACTHVHMTK